MTRRFVQPEIGETLGDIAQRVLPDEPSAVEQLMSWNLHLAMRMPIGPAGSLLSSDVIFIEAPQP